MNIRDTGNATETLRIDTAAVRNNQARTITPRTENTAERIRREQPQDQYVQTTQNFTGSALYQISDVRRGRHIYNDERYQEQRSLLTGKKVTEKVVDIILPPGVKNLKIFRTEPYPE